jgi:cation-transporting P-type ATPase C
MAPQGNMKRFVICHAIRGRLRVRFVSLHLTEARAYAFAQWLCAQPEVEEAQVRQITGSIIVKYNPEKTPQKAVLSILRSVSDEMWDLFSHHDATPTGQSPQKSGIVGTKNQFNFGRSLLWVICITSFSLYNLIRRIILKSPLPEGMFGLSGLVAAIGTIPIIRQGIKDFRQRRGVGLYLFLGGACILAIAAGQATAALEVAWVTSLSMFIEGYVTDKSRRAIRESPTWRAKNAFVVVDGEEREIPLSQVKKGNTISIHSGERIPVDGIVADGEALVDEAHLTGRAEPELRTPGDFVYAGTLIKFGSLRVNAEKVGEDTYISSMLRRVEEALSNRAPVERKADILARRLTLLGSVATLGTLLFTGQLVRALTVMLVAACPCATALAASTAITAAIANSAKKRVFIKGGLYLERISSMDCFCFDKTGTITIETSTVEEIVDLGLVSDSNRVLALAFAAEMHNPHPIARAIVNKAQEAGITLTHSTDSEVALGRGVSVRMEDDVIVVGNAQLMEDQSIEIDPAIEQSNRFLEQGRTVVYVAKNGNLEGLIVLSNEVRPGTTSLMETLKKDGVQEIYLVTGDLDPVAKALARDLHLDGYRASLLPEAKAHFIEQLKVRGRQVAMVGDGVNDALALSNANIGIAMGAGGSEVALEAADIALVDSDLTRLLMLRQLSWDTMRVIEQNHWLAVSTNLIGMALGAFGTVGPVVAGLIHIVHTLGIMLNSGKLLTWDQRTNERKTTRPVTALITRQANGGVH